MSENKACAPCCVRTSWTFQFSLNQTTGVKGAWPKEVVSVRMKLNHGLFAAWKHKKVSDCIKQQKKKKKLKWRQDCWSLFLRWCDVWTIFCFRSENVNLTFKIIVATQWDLESNYVKWIVKGCWCASQGHELTLKRKSPWM